MTRPTSPRPAGCRGARLAFVLSLALVASACARPRVATRPLDLDAVLARVRTERAACTSGTLELREAVALMRRHNPEIREARAEAEATRRFAATPTPYPNPSLDVGPLLLGGGDVLSGATLGVEAALGWTVLLTDTPALTNDVNRVRADAALTEAAATEREQYLALRGDFAQVLLQADLRSAREDLATAARSSTEIAQRAVEAGEATALDVRLLGLEAAEIQAELLETEEDLALARGQLGARTGSTVCASRTAPSAADLAPLPDEIPDLETLQETVIRHHPRLAALRAEYAVVEKELRLEVAKAYPPLGMGLSYEYEDIHKFGLPLSIEVPIFDRNQPGIAEACARRQARREQFVAEVNRLFAAVEIARARLEVRRRQLDLRGSQLEPSEQTRQLAEDVLQQTGTLDMLRYLEVLRATRRATVSYLASRLDVYEAWSELEQACGAPLLRFAPSRSAARGRGGRARRPRARTRTPRPRPAPAGAADAMNQGDA